MQDAFGKGGPNGDRSASDDSKKEAVAQSVRANQKTPEDQTRSTLHYGDEHGGEERTTGASFDGAEYSFGAANEAPFTSSADPDSGPRGADNTPPGLARQRLEEIPPLSDDMPGHADRGAGRPAHSAGQAHPTVDQTGADIEPTAPEPQPGPVGGSVQPAAAGGGRGAGGANRSEQDTASPENSVPTSIEISSQAIAESTEGAVVGTLSVTDHDANGSHSFTVSDDRFEVADGQVRLKRGISLDHTEADGLTLEITATDADGASAMQSFKIAVTDVNDAPVELSLSNHAIAEKSDGAVVGTLSVTDHDANGSHSFTVSDDRFEVADGQVRLKQGISLDHTEADGLTLEITATDSDGASVTQSFEIAVADVPDIALGTGFHARYFDMNETIRALDDVDWNGPVTNQELVDEIDYPKETASFREGGSRDTVGAQITGSFEVEEGGTFTFHVGGGDGMVLLVNGKEVVDNDGSHAYRTHSGEIELEPGTHAIEVRYFENNGHAGLKVEWEGPGLDGRELLTPPTLDNLQTVNGMPVILTLQTDAPQDAAGGFSQVIDGLPPGTLVQAGGSVTEIGETGTADITGWDTAALTITPPVEFIGAIDAQLSATVTLDSGDVTSSVTPFSIAVDQADLPAAPLELQAGFRASYFDVGRPVNSLDQIDWDTDPTKEEVISEVNYAHSHDSFWESGSTETFGVRITGEVTVDEAGNYEFYLSADEGAVLYIDGQEVVENGRARNYRTRTGDIELEPGPHEIEIRYFEHHGRAGLKLEWEGPGTEGRELVKADTGLAMEENGALNLRLANSDTGPEGTVTISGLPPDTILVSGAHSAVSDGSEIDLSGWDLDLIELMPPPGFEGMIDAEFTVTGQAFNGETVVRAETFSFGVGDETAVGETGSADDNLLLADNGDTGATIGGWSDDGSAGSGGDDATADDDDVMEEPVSDCHESEQSHDMTETYERHDW